MRKLLIVLIPYQLKLKSNTVIKKLVFLLPLLLSWTALSAQMQDSHKDSTICFNQEELRVISLKLIGANECDTLLKISEKLGQYKDSTIIAQSNIISKQEIQLAMYDTIVNKYADQIEYLGTSLEESNNKLKVFKVAFYGATSAFALSLLYIALGS